MTSTCRTTRWLTRVRLPLCPCARCTPVAPLRHAAAALLPPAHARAGFNLWFAAAGLEDQDVVTKYKEAARIANSALEAVIAACTAGANLVRSLPRCRTPIRQRLTMARSIGYTVGAVQNGR